MSNWEMHVLEREVKALKAEVLSLREKARRIYTPSGFYMVGTEREAVKLRQEFAKQLNQKEK